MMLSQGAMDEIWFCVSWHLSGLSMGKLPTITTSSLGDVIQTSHPLLFPTFPTTLSLSHHQGLFQWVNPWHQVAEVFSFNISPSNDYSGLISFRMDWLDLLAVQVTRKSFLQHHSSKASVLSYSACFIILLSHPYMTTGKTIALTRQAFVAKLMSLLYNMLSRLVITFLPRSKHLLIFSAQLSLYSNSHIYTWLLQKP